MKGFCPSFVTVEGGALKKSKTAYRRNHPATAGTHCRSLRCRPAKQPYNILINGIGGTGVITVGATWHGRAPGGQGRVGAGHDRHVAENGSVTSHVKIASTPAHLRIATGEAT